MWTWFPFYCKTHYFWIALITKNLSFIIPSHYRFVVSIGKKVSSRQGHITGEILIRISHGSLSLSLLSLSPYLFSVLLSPVSSLSLLLFLSPLSFSLLLGGGEGVSWLPKKLWVKIVTYSLFLFHIASFNTQIQKIIDRHVCNSTLSLCSFMISNSF